MMKSLRHGPHARPTWSVVDIPRPAAALALKTALDRSPGRRDAT